MRKRLVIVVLVCLMLTVVAADGNKIKDNNSTKNAENNHECISQFTTTIKLPLFIRLFGKKPLRFIKKSIVKILGKNITLLKKHSNRSNATLKDHKLYENETSTEIFTARNLNGTTVAITTNGSVERPTYRSGWSKKTYVKDMSYYRRFVYTPERYTPPVKVRKYYTPEGSPYIQEKTNQRTTKIDASRTTSKVFVSTEHDSNGGKRQRRSSVHDGSDSEQGYTYLLRKKRSESTFNPYAYLTKLSKRPVFTGDYTPRRYPTYSSAATTSTSTKSVITTKPKTFVRTVTRIATTPKPVFRTTLRQWYHRKYSATSQPTVTSTVTSDKTKADEKKNKLTTRVQHYWVNNWNLPVVSYYMHPVNHTFRTYAPAITTHDPSSPSKTTRAMYYLTQYWNKGYFSYYTNFDPSDESKEAFAKRLGYFPDATTRFKKFRMMPKRYRPEGYVDLFSIDSFVRNINKCLKDNKTYPPPHERDSISASVEDVSYWFFFNNSVTIDQLNPGTRWKNKPKPTMKPMPSYFFKDSIITRYYPSSREKDLQKAAKISQKLQQTRSTNKHMLTTRWFDLHLPTIPSTAVHTSASHSTIKLPRIRTYETKIRTTIPTFPTNRETTARNIDPFGLLNKIIQYNIQLKRPFRHDDTNIHQSTLHPVNKLPRLLKLPFTLSPNMMLYTDYRGKQLFTLLGKYHIHENNKTLECVRNPSEFLNPFNVVAPPPDKGFYRIIQRHRIRGKDVIDKKPARRNDDNDSNGHQKFLPNDPTVALELRFYPLRTTGTIKTWNEYLASKMNESLLDILPTKNANR